jgi:hypothetical protein
MTKTAVARRPRGRPAKTPEALRRDHMLSSLANLSVWLMVESKRKGAPGMPVSQACDLIVQEAAVRRETAPKVAREMLDRKHKYLLNADTLRRRYAGAEALRQQVERNKYAVIESRPAIVARCGGDAPLMRPRYRPQQRGIDTARQWGKSIGSLTGRKHWTPCHLPDGERTNGKPRAGRWSVEPGPHLWWEEQNNILDGPRAFRAPYCHYRMAVPV